MSEFVCQPVEEAAYKQRRKEPGPKHQPSSQPPPPQPDEPPESAPAEEPETETEPVAEPEKAVVARTLSMSPEQFESLLARIVAEARKPVLDELKVAQQKRTREHNRQIMADNRKMQINRFYNCNHMQLPGSVMSGCAAIAWATQSDGKRRGVCQHCGTVFSSERSECVSDEIWQAYKMLVRLPTHPSGNINNVFQSA